MELVRSFCLLSLLASTAAASNDWLNHGGNLLNRRFVDKETKISPGTASRLRLKWKFNAGRDISATPAIFDGTLYFPSWDGYIYAIKASNGGLLWKKNLQHLTGLNSTGAIFDFDPKITVSRSTPVIAHDMLVFGLGGPAYVVAVKRFNGRLVWLTQLDKHSKALITMSGTYYKGHVYVGTSSNEETVSIEQCCIFRGSFVKLNARTGKILWRTYMLPDNFGRLGEYAGAAVWGSSPSIDIYRNHVYIATGNLYSAPKNIRHYSIIALDLDTGKIKWFNQLGGYDVWFFACNNVSNPKCPPGPNLGDDFAAAPMMLTTYVDGIKRDLAVAVQKSGFAWALDRDNGKLIWSTFVDKILRDIHYHTLTGNLERRKLDLVASQVEELGEPPQMKRGSTPTLLTPIARTSPYSHLQRSRQPVGGWRWSGRVLWSTADPSNGTANGPVTVANGVLIGGSTFRQGPIYAMNAMTGEILWSYKTGATICGGALVSNGCIYLGHGYKVSVGLSDPGFTAGNSLFAFCVA
ncbi:hypothetical protein CXB51_003842 [Gossypium anomalum]|uniref:Pyrrolo-quinoline quinone repeat domain-containing protein n=1 Tax=Gossypium anomalum TaxID=47600 RepID=A0A8J6A112_9ROSI|nr:hypothetical protein CXB51_003842 [Gossypium anomalum]